MPRNVVIVGLGEKSINLVIEEDLSVVSLKERICQRKHVEANSFFLAHNGVPLDDTTFIGTEDYSIVIVRAHPIIRGGKGGFGSLIRAIGMQINKSNNKQACRDLSGRRVRDVNAEKKIAKWLKAEPERRKKLAEEKRKRLTERRAQPKHYFEDHKYMEQIKNSEESMGDALKQGLEAASSSKGMKRKQPASNGSSKKPKLWLGIDDAELDSGSDDDDDDDEEFAEEGMVSTGESSDNVDDSWDRPGPSGLQNMQCSSEGTTLQDDGPSTCSNSEHDPREDPPVLSQEVDNGGKERVDPECETKEDVLPVKGGTVTSNDMNKRTETVNESVSEENRGSNEPASVGGSSGENTGSNEPASVGGSSGENTGSDEPASVDDGSGKNDKETSEKEEGNTPSVHQQYPKATEGCTHEPINLDSYNSAEELESAGLERLKVALQVLRLKCGGTLQERAQRLFSTKGKTVEELDPSLFAKAGKQRKRKK